MTTTTRAVAEKIQRSWRPWLGSTSMIGAPLLWALGIPATLAGDVDHDYRQGRFCSATARTLYTACQNETRDDFYTAQAICINLRDKQARAECFAKSQEDYRGKNQICRAQRTGRLNKKA